MGAEATQPKSGHKMVPGQVIFTSTPSGSSRLPSASPLRSRLPSIIDSNGVMFSPEAPMGSGGSPWAARSEGSTRNAVDMDDETETVSERSDASDREGFDAADGGDAAAASTASASESDGASAPGGAEVSARPKTKWHAFSVDRSLPRPQTAPRSSVDGGGAEHVEEHDGGSAFATSDALLGPDVIGDRQPDFKVI